MGGGYFVQVPKVFANATEIIKIAKSIEVKQCLTTKDLRRNRSRGKEHKDKNHPMLKTKEVALQTKPNHICATDIMFKFGFMESSQMMFVPQME